ncbi:MMPL family transporter [Dehalococcoidia bacterium]|nr:MMPL family transporter [Dehalococcoidia bacterium]
MFHLLARLVSSKRGNAAIISLAVILVVLLRLNAPPLSDVTTNQQEDFLPRGADSVRAIQLVQTKFPSSQGIPALLVVHKDTPFTENDFNIVKNIDALLQGDGAPTSIQNVLSLFSYPEAKATLLSKNEQSTMLVISISGAFADSAVHETVNWIRSVTQNEVANTGIEVSVTGPAGIATDLTDVFSDIDFKVTSITILLVLTLLLLIYRSPILAILPIIGVSWALVVAHAIAALLTKNFDLALNDQVISIMSVLMFGVGTDFTLFIVSRYREELTAGFATRSAMQKTMQNIGPAITSSAGTTFIAMLALILSQNGSFKAMGPMLAVAILVMLLFGLTVIPVLTVLLGKAAFWPFKIQKPKEESKRFWKKVGNLVARKPGTVMIITLSVLLLFTSGLPSMKPSFNFLDSFPQGTDSRRGFELLKNDFVPGELAPTNVLITGDNSSIYNHLEAIEYLSYLLAEHPGVVQVNGPTRPQGTSLTTDFSDIGKTISLAIESGEKQRFAGNTSPENAAALAIYLASQPFVSQDQTTAKLQVVLNIDPYSTTAMDMIGDLRQVAKVAADQTTLSSFEIVIGGETAVNTDTRTSINRDILFVAPLIILAIWIILVLLLRSLIAPTFLVISVLISFLAALGLSVLVFQKLLGHEGVAYSLLPWMFIFLVALGVDYNIYIMSRVREEIRRFGLLDGTREAISQTGGVITSAGLILAGTFSVFTTLPLRDLFQLGFAVAVGILLDTFIVRALLVPSVVLLLKKWTWWPSTIGSEKPNISRST